MSRSNFRNARSAALLAAVLSTAIGVTGAANAQQDDLIAAGAAAAVSQ